MGSGTDIYWKNRKKDEEVQKLIDKHRPKNMDHFYNGWKMYPEWWSNSTEDWQKGFKAREEYLKEKGQ